MTSIGHVQVIASHTPKRSVSYLPRGIPVQNSLLIRDENSPEISKAIEMTVTISAWSFGMVSSVRLQIAAEAVYNRYIQLELRDEVSQYSSCIIYHPLVQGRAHSQE